MTTESAKQTQQQNPFGDSTNTALALQQTGGMQVVAREESEAKAFIALARMNPRSQAQAWTQIQQSCQRPGFAEKGRYAFPRKNTTITGPSVNMAREIGRCWGNLRYGLRMVSVDDDYVHIKGWCHDGESNLYIEAEDRFKKKIQRKRDGQTIWLEPDERDLRELVNRRGALLIRNCILQVIPADIVEDAMNEIAKTLHRAAEGDIAKDKRGTIRAIAANFGEFGVTVPMLEEKLGHVLDNITPDEVATLRSMFAALKEGHETRDTLFGKGEAVADAKPKAEALADRAGRLAKGKKTASEPVAQSEAVEAATVRAEPENAPESLQPPLPANLATTAQVNKLTDLVLRMPKKAADEFKQKWNIPGAVRYTVTAWDTNHCEDCIGDGETVLELAKS